MKKPVTPMIIREFAGLEVRETPQAQMVAVDVLKAIGQKNPKASWTRLKRQYPELVQETCTYSSGRGRPAEVVTLRGAIKLAMLAKGPRAEQFRNWAAKLIEGYETADPTLTADLIDRTENADDVRWLADRAKARESALSLNQAIAGAECSEATFPKAHDTNNVAVTGLTAREIQKYRGGKVTRDLYSRAELSLVDTAQSLEVSAIGSRKARGDGQVLEIVREVAQDVASLRKKWLGPRMVPHGGVIQEEI